MSTIDIGSGMLQVAHPWATLKGMLQSKALLLQYVENDQLYKLFAVEGNVVHLCSLYKAGAPFVGIPETNGADLAEFEAGYKAVANKPLDLRAKDGRVVTRVTTASPGMEVHTRVFNFRSADPTSLVNKSPLDVDYNDATYVMKDASGNVTTDPAQAVKTEVDFEPTYNHEIAGGGFMVDSTLRGDTSGSWWVAALAAPTIPRAMGGQVPFCDKMNIGLIGNEGFRIDGRSARYTPIDTTYHSNRFRFIIWHPQGAQKNFTIWLETFGA